MYEYYVSENIDMILYTPVLSKMLKQYELWDGTYIISDLFDIHEAMSVKNLNEKLFFEKQMKEIENKNEINNISNSFNLR